MKLSFGLLVLVLLASCVNLTQESVPSSLAATTPRDEVSYQTPTFDEPTVIPTPTSTPEPTQTPVPEWEYDVVVVGSGPGGFAASLQAARMGRKVVLMEETDWVGGQMTAAGVSTMDEGRQVLQKPFGIYAEFVDQVSAYYQRLGKSIETCYWGPGHVCFEPHVGREILVEMLEETKVDIWLTTRVEEVLLSEGRIEGVRTDRGIVLAPVLVDATEWGDVLGLIHGSYRLGEEIQDITWVATIRQYPEGPPAELIMQEPPGYEAEKFSNKLRLYGNSGWPIEFPVSWEFHNRYRGLPNSLSQSAGISKTGLNWFNDFSITPEAVEDLEERQRQTCQAKLRTLQLLYYIQTEIDSRWAVADDEGYNTPFNQEHVCFEQFRDIEVQMPLIPYVREARRMVGITTLLGSQIRRVEFEDAVAWGDYAIDLHGARQILDFGESWEDIAQPNKGLFGIPTGVFLSSELDGLMAVEKNISQSRLANGATRLQPVAMSGGQAAGVIAALWPEFDVTLIQEIVPKP